MAEFPTCPHCGRKLRSSAPTGPYTSAGECGKHGLVTVRWLGGRNGPRGAQPKFGPAR